MWTSAPASAPAAKNTPSTRESASVTSRLARSLSGRVWFPGAGAGCAGPFFVFMGRGEGAGPGAGFQAGEGACAGHGSGEDRPALFMNVLPQIFSIAAFNLKN